MGNVFGTDVETATEIIKEEKRMVRKAETLKSLGALNLSNRTRSYLEMHFATIDEVVREGRIDAFEQYLGVQLKDKAPKWKTELIATLEDAGFIRPAADFAMTFRINGLYSVVVKPEWEDCFIKSIHQLSNEQYEEFQSLSDDLIEEVKAALLEYLTGREYDVMCRRFGLDGDSVPRDLESVGKYFNVTRERIRQIEARALRKLRHPSMTLPAIYNAPSEMEETAEALYAELEQLYESPVFKRADEIVWKLESMKKAPFKYECKYLKDGALNETRIEELDLSIRTNVCLRRGGIATIADIINLPSKDWFRIRNLGRKSMEEIIEKMHSIGYGDFNIPISSRSITQSQPLS